jgi:glycosyltransferase involved in cell wall biosynthesis
VTDDILISDLELEARKRRLRDATRPLGLVCAGRQIRIKGTDQMIGAVAKLIEQNVRVELNVMGDGDDLAAFKKLAGELNLTEFVRFSGTVPYGRPLFDEWAKADIMLVANLTAEISRNVLLSLARGLPLVTYANPGTDDLLGANDAAAIVPKGDVDALAQRIADLSQHRERLVELADHGLTLARQKTLSATHRRRAELAALLFKVG